MSLGDRFREWLPVSGGQTRRRDLVQAHPVAAPDHGRPVRRAPWVALTGAVAAAGALTAGLVFLIMSLMRPAEQRASATPTLAPLVANPSPSASAPSVAEIFVTLTPATTVSPAPLRAERAQVANTDGQGVNLRGEPSTTSERVRLLPEGTLVEVIGPDHDADGRRWRNVRDSDGGIGWVPASFLAAEGAVPPPSTAREGSPRTSPGTSEAAPAAAPRPAATQPGGASGATTRPTVTPSTGARATGAPSGGAAPTPRAAPARGQVANTGGQGANLRSEPGSRGRVVKTLTEGSAVEFLGPEREVEGRIWRQIRDSAGVTGWILASVVGGPSAQPVPGPSGTRPSGPAGVQPRTPTPLTTPVPPPSLIQPGSTPLAPAAAPPTGTPTTGR